VQVQVVPPPPTAVVDVVLAVLEVVVFAVLEVDLTVEVVRVVFTYSQTSVSAR
jgi:hypothetical protein